MNNDFPININEIVKNFDKWYSEDIHSKNEDK